MAKGTDDNKKKLEALKVTLAKLDKTYGKGTVMKLTDDNVVDIPSISTGSLGLDIALGIGGLPRGRVVEIYGPESSGKTTLTLHAIAEAQRQGGLAAFIDAEHAFDRAYAQNLGVDLDNLLISQPDNGEQALEIAEQLIRSTAIDIVVIDSVAALVPKAELEGDMGDSKMGLQARLMSQALRKLTGVISKTQCTCIFINQLRDKIGVMFGSPETTTGGNALKFYSSVRLDIRRIGAIKDGDKITGNRTRVSVKKNKLAPPFKQVEFDIMYGRGISKAGEILDLAVDLDIVKKSGSWYSYGDNKLGQGRDSVKALIEEDEVLMADLEGQLRELDKAANAADKESKSSKKGKKAEKAIAEAKKEDEENDEDFVFEDEELDDKK
ncbi:protein RecA [Bernardetia litoralis DSM 6794]|uniref:Protein RecA n=1 Tax=Bernardetia litoralis (strain ATCC 23117 / DSM 6794 / NBRC 15988 / NCIMB 1366 / Fx l1 / Sio-4) TaxID=880071 RepID=I4AHU2_BERLS|nr:recombinase RecA [Bernardetia litoralis]AFM03527.1 protein RecA [Bernardetia litoralis DSM 6794]